MTLSLKYLQRTRKTQLYFIWQIIPKSAGFGSATPEKFSLRRLPSKTWGRGAHLYVLPSLSPVCCPHLHSAHRLIHPPQSHLFKGHTRANQALGDFPHCLQIKLLNKAFKFLPLSQLLQTCWPRLWLCPFWLLRRSRHLWRSGTEPPRGRLFEWLLYTTQTTHSFVLVILHSSLYLKCSCLRSLAIKAQVSFLGQILCSLWKISAFSQSVSRSTSPLSLLDTSSFWPLLC